MELFQERLLDKKASLEKKYETSVFYHSIFGYPLKESELERWMPGEKVKPTREVKSKVLTEKEYVFLEGQRENIYRRSINEKFSRSKIKIAQKAANVLKNIPSIKMIGITGSLAMLNAREESDIDLMIIVAEGTLWTTRIFSYLVLLFSGIKVRKANDPNEKDKLCLNIWLDEKSIEWKRKNVFTAHEIFQIRPLVDRGKTHEKFIKANSWALDYWPKAYRKSKVNGKPLNLGGQILTFLFRAFEPLSFWIQYIKMRDKITREVVTPSRALFHPVDWSKAVRSSGF